MIGAVKGASSIFSKSVFKTTGDKSYTGFNFIVHRIKVSTINLIQTNYIFLYFFLKISLLVFLFLVS